MTVLPVELIAADLVNHRDSNAAAERSFIYTGNPAQGVARVNAVLYNALARIANRIGIGNIMARQADALLAYIESRLRNFQTVK